MNVKEMLHSCDIEQTAALHFIIQEPPACKDWERFLQAHRDFIQEIKNITPIPSDNVVFGIEFYASGKPYVEIHMYDKNELLKNFQRCEAWEEDRLLETYANVELEQINPDTLGYTVHKHYDMELMPWEEVLGVEVFEKNLHAFGHDQLAAMVIREISFWGLGYEQFQQGQNDVWKRLLEAIQALNERSCIPAEQIYKALGLSDRIDEGDGEDLAMEEKVPSGDMHITFLEYTPDYWMRSSIAAYRELLRYVAHSSGEACPMLFVCAGVEGAGKTSFCGVIRDAYAHIMETVLSATDIEQIRKARQEGFYIRLVYLGLNTLEEHLQRIQNRVARGGSDADPVEVERQFQHRFAALTEVLSLCHEAAFYDCTNGFCRVAEYHYSQLNVTQAGRRCMWLNEWLDTEPPEKMVTVWSDSPSYE